MSGKPTWKIKRFNELSAAELYDFMRLRSEVFVVEQNCVYQDIDGKDYRALHLIGDFQGKTVGYARLFDSGDYFENASIGRVVVDATFRDRKWGHELVQRAISAIDAYYNKTQITISAQQYLQKFYEQHGFAAVGEIYDEDGIPHIRMERT
ncbi:MAG TPA: GNAT family N-acetyltransferase [Flavobacterium sp.]|jgi:ElaA protein